MSALGQKQTYALLTSHVCFTPNSDRESGLPQPTMSALPPKADMCSANEHVCFGPIADIAASFDHFVSRQKNAIRYSNAKCLGRFEIDY
jgi:hypothetical protein